jgi:hypothetical protein
VRAALHAKHGWDHVRSGTRGRRRRATLRWLSKEMYPLCFPCSNSLLRVAFLLHLLVRAMHRMHNLFVQSQPSPSVPTYAYPNASRQYHVLARHSLKSRHLAIIIIHLISGSGSSATKKTSLALQTILAATSIPCKDCTNNTC